MTHAANTPHATDHGGAFGFAREGYHRAEVHDLTASDIEDAKVYDRSDDSIGSVTDLKVGADGKITHAIIDVGGFLGMGAHSVKLPFEQLTVLRKTDGDDVRVHLDATKEQLKALPHHDAK